MSKAKIEYCSGSYAIYYPENNRYLSKMNSDNSLSRILFNSIEEALSTCEERGDEIIRDSVNKMAKEVSTGESEGAGWYLEMDDETYDKLSNKQWFEIAKKIQSGERSSSDDSLSWVLKTY